MKKIISILATPLLFAAVACNNGSKPASETEGTNDTTTSVGAKDTTINDKKAIVIEPTDKKSANMITVPPACNKCLVDAVQQTAEFKSLNIPATSSEVVYEVNWTPSAAAAKQTIAVNDLKLNINKGGTILSSFIYDNAASKLFLVKDDAKTEVKADESSLKKIKTACY
jgi:hypothetical protein